MMNDRRILLKSAVILGSSFAVASVGHAFAAKSDDDPMKQLMQEHGGLNRIMMIYDHVALQIEQGKNFDIDLLKKSATLLRDFVEGFHEKLEEDYLFPAFRKAGKLTELVTVLDEQHSSGRLLTATIISTSHAATLKSASDLSQLRKVISSFTRMYRPHESREDTVLFPEFKKLVSEKEYADVAAQIAKRQRAQFGQDGFEKVIAQIADIEKSVGLYELAQFTAAKSPEKEAQKKPKAGKPDGT